MMVLIKKIHFIVLILLPVQLLGQSLNPDLLRMQAALEKSDYSAVLANNILPGDRSERAIYYLQKGKAEFLLGNIEKSTILLTSANDLIPGLASLELAHCYKILGNKQQLFSYLAEHLNSDSKSPRKDIMLDPVFSDLDRDRDWIRFWSDKWYSELEELQAEAAYRVINKDTDHEFWNDLIMNHQDNAVLLTYQGQFYMLIDESRKAAQSFEKALKLDPDIDLVKLKYADFLIEENKFDHALDLYNSLIEKQPYEITYYILQARAVVASGQSGAGVKAIENLESLGIDASDLNLLIAKELVEGDPEKAIEYLDPVISNSPNKIAFNLRAQSFINTGNTEDAIKDYAMSLDIDPKQPNVYFNRAKLRLDSGDTQGACYDWENALELGHRHAADMLYKYCK